MMGPGNTINSMVSIYFLLIYKPKIENFQDCCTLTRSSETHSFGSSNVASLTIHTRKLACFFSFCMHRLWDECESKEWVDQWSCRTFHPIDSYQLPIALQLNQVLASTDFEHVSNLVELGTKLSIQYLVKIDYFQFFH